MKMIIYEIKYFVTVFKKTWVSILIPICLSIFLYIYHEIPIPPEISELFHIPSIIIKGILYLYWVILFFIETLYYCQLRFKLKIIKFTFFSMLIIEIIFFAIYYLLDDHYFHKKLSNSDFGTYIEFFFLFFIYPFCVIRLKHFFHFLLIYIKKYIWLIISLFLFDFMVYMICDKVSRLPNFMQSMNFTAINVIGYLYIIIYPCTGVIMYKNRKKIKFYNN